MKKEDFVTIIKSHATLVSFTYLGKPGDVDPFSDTLYRLFYDGQQMEVYSIDAVMQTAFYAGKSLNKIFDHLKDIDY